MYPSRQLSTVLRRESTSKSLHRHLHPDLDYHPDSSASQYTDMALETHSEPCTYISLVVPSGWKNEVPITSLISTATALLEEALGV